MLKNLCHVPQCFAPFVTDCIWNPSVLKLQQPPLEQAPNPYYLTVFLRKGVTFLTAYVSISFP